jgi:hypothetical protein
VKSQESSGGVPGAVPAAAVATAVGGGITGALGYKWIFRKYVRAEDLEIAMHKHQIGAHPDLPKGLGNSGLSWEPMNPEVRDCIPKSRFDRMLRMQPGELPADVSRDLHARAKQGVAVVHLWREEPEDFGGSAATMAFTAALAIWGGVVLSQHASKDQWSL